MVNNTASHEKRDGQVTTCQHLTADFLEKGFTALSLELSYPEFTAQYTKPWMMNNGTSILDIQLDMEEGTPVTGTHWQSRKQTAKWVFLLQTFPWTPTRWHYSTMGLDSNMKLERHHTHQLPLWKIFIYLKGRDWTRSFTCWFAFLMPATAGTGPDQRQQLETSPGSQVGSRNSRS